jgi:hypothetical protein
MEIYIEKIHSIVWWQEFSPATREKQKNIRSVRKFINGKTID